jgi:hypothetical protein
MPAAATAVAPASAALSRVGVAMTAARTAPVSAVPAMPAAAAGRTIIGFAAVGGSLV